MPGRVARPRRPHDFLGRPGPGADCEPTSRVGATATEPRDAALRDSGAGTRMDLAYLRWTSSVPGGRSRRDTHCSMTAARWTFRVPPTDLACTWNTVFSEERPAAFIDWDLSAPGPRWWDVAYALWHFVPLYGDTDSDPFDVALRAARPAGTAVL